MLWITVTTSVTLILTTTKATTSKTITITAIATTITAANTSFNLNEPNELVKNYSIEETIKMSNSQTGSPFAWYERRMDDSHTGLNGHYEIWPV